MEKPKRHTQGSFVLELILWLLLILPGIIYSVWRLTSRVEVCPVCRGRQLIPPDSPRARSVL